jgi:hypothetical protein
MQICVSDGTLPRIDAEFPAILAISKKKDKVASKQAVAQNIQPRLRSFSDLYPGEVIKSVQRPVGQR